MNYTDQFGFNKGKSLREEIVVLSTVLFSCVHDVAFIHYRRRISISSMAAEKRLCNTYVDTHSQGGDRVVGEGDHHPHDQGSYIPRHQSYHTPPFDHPGAFSVPLHRS